MAQSENEDGRETRLSLLTAYRRRSSQLEVFLAWLSRFRQEDGFSDFELILAEGDVCPTAREVCSCYPWITYTFTEMVGLFNKASLLNRAAILAQGAFLMPLDVDLLPGKGVLERHISLAEQSPACLLSGYRIQLPSSLNDPVGLSFDDLILRLKKTNEALICEEDRYTASLMGRLLDCRRFGVCPCLPAEGFKSLGGYHEGYVGWGGEDQDLIERVCAGGLALVRCYDLVYLHLSHGTDEVGWREENLITTNRNLYFTRRRSWNNGHAERNGQGSE